MRKPFAALALFVYASVDPPPAPAADFASGLKAYQQGDYAAAFKEWLPLAEEGNAAAQFNLGLMYHDGRGAPQDFGRAVRWFREAAEQDYGKAQYNLGAMYGIGQGVKRDYVEAHKWLNLCASKGDAKCAAQRDLVEKKLSGAKLRQAQRLASDWKPRTTPSQDPR